MQTSALPKGSTMNTRTLWITALALCLGACGEKAPPESQPDAAAAMPADAEQAAMATSRTDIDVDAAFVSHMHAHADRLDELMFALDDGDLDAARTPAYWLSRHEEISGFPDDLQQYVASLRDAALAVELATDLESARVAAEDISAACQGCHDAAGVVELD